MSGPSGWRSLTPHDLVGGDKSRLAIGPFGSSLKVSDYRDEGVPLVFVRDVRAGSFQSPRHFVSHEKAEQLRSHLVEPGDVLVTKMGDPPGDACVYTGHERGVITADCIRLRPAEGFDPRYISYAIQAPGTRQQIEAITSGVAQRKVSLARFRSGLNIPVPSINEQRRIVAILEDHLSRLNAADAELETASARLQSLRDRVTRDAITGAHISQREVVPPVVAGTADGDLPDLPVEWEWARLGDVADVVGGVTKDAKKQSDPANVEVPYLRVANVQRGGLRLDNVTSIRVPPAKAEALKLEPGDVLLNEGGDRDKLARGWVWEGQIDNCIHQNHVFRARVHEPRLDPYFLSLTANTIGGRWAERNGKQSVNLASISLRVIRKMPVIVPSPGAATEAVQSLTDQLQRLDRLEAAIAHARRHRVMLRRALLAAAFSGRLSGAVRLADTEGELMAV